MRLENKVAIVTGGASGIGRAIAIGYAKEGAKIVIADIDVTKATTVAEEIQAVGGNAQAIECDVASKEQVDAMVSKTVSDYGQVDILVNSAGYLEEIPLLEMTLEDWKKSFDINLKGVFLTTQACARDFVKHGGGKIINISSLASIRGRDGQAAYSTMKGGLLAMSGNIANQLGPEGVYMNNIIGGFTDTDFPESLNGNKPYQQYRIAACPARRLGKPEDYVGAAVFLAGNESDYVNGSDITVDGGASRMLSGIDFVDSDY